MPLPLPQGDTVTILRPGEPTRDNAGNYVPGLDLEIPYAGCAVWPDASTETTDAQDQVTERLSALLPYGADVQATDRARVYDRIFQVQGMPQSWRSPLTGTRGGIHVYLVRVTG